MLTWSNVVVEGAVYGLVGGALSQLGDLIASAIKRDTGIKDFGWIFPDTADLWTDLTALCL